MIRVLIVEDEPPARAKLRQLLAAEDDVVLAGEAADGDEAVRLLRETAVDLVLLDIRMPRRDGFGVIDEIGVEAMPLVVFVTAYDEHALRAFEVHALDYLLKPFAAPRFRRVLDRARQALARDTSAELAERLGRLLADAVPEPRYLQRIKARFDEDREALLNVAEIDVVRARGNYLRFHTARGLLTRRGTLSELEGKLDPAQFARINRSEIVRLDAVQELRPWFHGDTHVFLKDGTRLTWSRRYRDRLPDEL